MEIIERGYWTYIINDAIDGSPITGKYLFFSENRDLLIDLAKKILTKYGLIQAKVPIEGKNIGKDYVLCVYDESPRYKNEMKKYQDSVISCPNNNWKSDMKTLAGVYSNKFLEEKKLDE